MPKLTKEKKLEIIRNDFRLWCKNFVKMVDNKGQEVPFILNEQQLRLLEGLEKYNIVLKSRQLGITTFSIAYCLWLVCNKPNITTMILSYNLESTQHIFERLKAMYYSIPDQYKPKIKRDNKMELFLENGSRVIVKIAGNKELGRSFTCEYIHCSEFAFWTDYAQEKGLLGLENSLAKNPDSKIILESTANGLNEFYNIYRKASKGESKYKAFFFNWFENKELFREEYKLAEEWWKAQNHGQRFSRKDLEKDEIPLFEAGAQLQQICWRRWKLQDMTLEQFQQEYPSTPEEAFLSTNVGVFSMQKILERMNYLPLPLQKEELQGIELPKSLIPYLNKGLFLYKLPKAKERYYGGVDVASGTGGVNDYSAVSIFDTSGEQVAVFYRNDIPVYKFAEIVNDLGHFYNYAYLVVERNGYGLPLLQKLREDYQYMNLYKQRIFNEAGRKKHQLGFATTTANKQLIVQRFKEQFETGMILINDRETLEEMQIYQENEKGSLGNKRGEGKHDDLVMACCFAVEGLSKGIYYVDI
ncbi:hypothetical protein [Thermosediminibacter oceani]|uniref:Uncharacterized protein n=1 Tax=Thermosediminibacter oceani (strain ATCC BAA-1034 / DSM 16646 / JW/IW-1228P) TaxID=555079 RepID=D9S2Y5_THEOJ|nr:hypothetical protein [Thermosediminibacter oceani]ADL07762.1 conserved hypothetical protein [Thermosediminibacter oceani DSM 16646]